MTEISLDSIYRKSPNLVEADMDGVVVLLSVEEGVYLELGGVAGAIWKAIDGCANVGSIITRLLEQYDVNEATCTAETLSFLKQALQKRLIALV